MKSCTIQMQYAKRKAAVQMHYRCLAPLVGLEPTTYGLTVRRSTDWAKEACLSTAWLLYHVQLWNASVFWIYFQNLLHLLTKLAVEKLVTRGRIELPFAAWEAAVLTAWPTGLDCEIYYTSQIIYCQAYFSSFLSFLKNIEIKPYLQRTLSIQ